MKKAILALCITIVLFFAVGAIIEVRVGNMAAKLSSSDSTALGSTADVRFNSANTSTGLLATTTSRLLLATSTARVYAYIVNTSTTTRVYLNLNAGNAATLYSGIALMPGEKYEINSTNNLYYGAITAISDGTATTTVYEK